MKKVAIAGIAVAVVLVVAIAGYWVYQQGNQPPGEAPGALPAASEIGEASPGFIYGRITTYRGGIYEGRLRWGGGEEAFWGNYFNGYKDKNPWAEYVPADQLTEERPVEVFGFSFGQKEEPIDLGRPFMMRFGDIARIEAHGHGLSGIIEDRTEFDPDVRVILKSGTAFNLDQLAFGDFDDGVRVWDAQRGAFNLESQQIRLVELFPSPGESQVTDRLYGTVYTEEESFTGFLQWDREESMGRDELKGRTDEGPLGIRFNEIEAIARNERYHAVVRVQDGQEIELSGTRKVGPNNRGVYVDDVRFGRVLVSWKAFERVEFSAGGQSPTYEDFPTGGPLMGSLTTRTGQNFVGRLVFDLDESETTETLDAPSKGVDYTLPFGLVASIEVGSEEAAVRLHNGEALDLELRGDLGDNNAGMLVFIDGQTSPEYVSWDDVERIEFDRPSAMYP